MRFRPYYILGLVLFALLYLEPTFVGGVKVSYLWKVGALYFLFIGVLFRLHRNRHAFSCNTVWAGYLMCLWIVVAGLNHDTLSSSVIMAAQRLFPILVLHYLIVRSSTQQQLQRWLIFAVLFVAVSTFPFYLGLLEPLGSGYDVVALLGADRLGFVGIFQNQHVAPLTLALSALLASVYSLKVTFSIKKRLIVMAVAVFLCYTMLLTYARAGYAAFLLGGMSYMLFTGRINTALRIVFLGCVAFSIIYFIVPEIDVLKSRLVGDSRYTKVSPSDMTSVSSGRLFFWTTSIEIYAEQDPIAWLLGIGEETLKESMGQRIGIGIFAHNGFINELLLNGAVGFLAFISFLGAIYLDICKIREASMRKLGQSLFVAWLVFVFFQGGEFPLQYVFLFLFVAIGIADRQGAALPLKCRLGQ